MIAYAVAERFKGIQGEGVYAGTPMAFIRFVGCSVGKKICAACDTDFDRVVDWRGGGEYTARQLIQWAHPYRHICLTGGEPFDQNLIPLLEESGDSLVTRRVVHIETSGTVYDERVLGSKVWLCVSPKPGYRLDMLGAADEIKVIVPGLGPGDGWPTLEDAIDWANRWGSRKPIFLQPRNRRNEIDFDALHLCAELVKENPQLRLSVQLHKFLRER